MTVTTASDATALEHLLGSDQVLRDPESLERYRHDDAEWADSTAPLAVVLARSTDDVVTAVRWAAAAGVRVVPRGAGTGLSGGANAMADSIVVSLERMNRVLEVNTDERYAVTEPRRHQRRTPRGGRRARPLVPAGPGEPRPSRRSAATSRRTPAASAASSTGSPATTCSA